MQTDSTNDAIPISNVINTQDEINTVYNYASYGKVRNKRENNGI